MTRKEKPSKNTARQQRWRRRRQAQGRRSVTVMVSAETKAVLDKERARTGETLAQVVERAVAALCRRPAEPDPVTVTSDGRALTVKIPMDRVDPKRPPAADPAPTGPPLADALLQGLISKKRRP